MRFRMCPYFVALHVCGVVVSMVTVAFGIWFWCCGIPGSDNRELGNIFAVLGALFGLETLKLMRAVSFPWFFFSQHGVKKEWLFKVHVFMAWEECAEIGMIYAKLAGGRHHGPLNWIYFSRVPLTDEQLNAQKRPRFKQADFIMIEYRHEVLEELLKYIDKDDIRNLHLLKD